MFNCSLKSARRLKNFKRLLHSLDETDYRNAKIDSRYKYRVKLVYNPNWIEFNEMFNYILIVEPMMLLTTRKINWDAFSYLIRDKSKLEIILDFGIQYIRIPSEKGYLMVTHYIPDLLRTRALIGDSNIEKKD